MGFGALAATGLWPLAEGMGSFHSIVLSMDPLTAFRHAYELDRTGKKGPNWKKRADDFYQFQK